MLGSSFTTTTADMVRWEVGKWGRDTHEMRPWLLKSRLPWPVMFQMTTPHCLQLAYSSKIHERITANYHTDAVATVASRIGRVSMENSTRVIGTTWLFCW